MSPTHCYTALYNNPFYTVPNNIIYYSYKEQGQATRVKGFMLLVIHAQLHVGANCNSCLHDGIVMHIPW